MCSCARSADVWESTTQWLSESFSVFLAFFLPPLLSRFLRPVTSSAVEVLSRLVRMSMTILCKASQPSGEPGAGDRGRFQSYSNKNLIIAIRVLSGALLPFFALLPQNSFRLSFRSLNHCGLEFGIILPLSEPSVPLFGLTNPLIERSESHLLFRFRASLCLSNSWRLVSGV